MIKINIPIVRLETVRCIHDITHYTELMKLYSKSFNQKNGIHSFCKIQYTYHHYFFFNISHIIFQTFCETSKSLKIYYLFIFQILILINKLIRGINIVKPFKTITEHIIFISYLIYVYLLCIYVRTMYTKIQKYVFVLLISLINAKDMLYCY